jgi:hypothetical protein
MRAKIPQYLPGVNSTYANLPAQISENSGDYVDNGNIMVDAIQDKGNSTTRAGRIMHDYIPWC